MVVSNVTDLVISETTATEGNKLVFNGPFCFNNVDDDFCVKAEVFCILPNSKRNFLESFFNKVIF